MGVGPITKYTRYLCCHTRFRVAKDRRTAAERRTAAVITTAAITDAATAAAHAAATNSDRHLYLFCGTH